MIIKENYKVLFQGDSITDCKRDRQDLENLGNGYPMMAASYFNATYPSMNVTFVNKGISGNRAASLVLRWKQDTIDLKPDLVSILIGINDTWRKFDRNDPTSAEKFEAEYRNILAQLKDDTNAKIIILEPFLLPVTEEQKKYWREDLEPKIEVAKKLSIEFDTLYIPLDRIFSEVCKYRDPEFWAKDGVHPTPYGHALIAKEWFKVVGAM